MRNIREKSIIIANKKIFILLKRFKIGLDKTIDIAIKKRNRILCLSKVKEPAINKKNKPTNKVNALIIQHTIFY